MGGSAPGECPHTDLQGPDNSLVQYKIQMLKYLYTLTVETVTYLMALCELGLFMSACAAPEAIYRMHPRPMATAAVGKTGWAVIAFVTCTANRPQTLVTHLPTWSLT